MTTHGIKRTADLLIELILLTGEITLIGFHEVLSRAGSRGDQYNGKPEEISTSLTGFPQALHEVATTRQNV